MSVMLSELYSALKEAQVSDAQASKAAQEVANFEMRIQSIERDLSVLKWMVGTNVALTVAVLGKLLLT